MAKPKILVVDDDLPIRILMQNILREFQFETLLAGSGPEALEIVSKETPEVILLDLNMPGMSGEETLTALRQVPHIRETPVLILTGDPVSAERLARIGAHAAVQKPFDLPALISQIRDAIGP